MAEREEHLEGQCCALAMAHGVYTIKLGRANRRGAVDRLFAYRGRVAFVEFKHPAGTGRVHALQKKELDALRAAHNPVYVIASLSDFYQVLETLGAWP